MCTLAFAYKVHSDYPFVFVGNRDEFYERPTEQLTWWKDEPDTLAGKDLKDGGTWTGINRLGKFAALTNYRDGFQEQRNAPSRGKIITDFFHSDLNESEYKQKLEERASVYNGFNLVYGTVDQLYFLSNRPEQYSLKLDAGIYGLSNGKLNESWPKVEYVKTKMASWFAMGDFPVEQAFKDMANENTYPDNVLPDTHIPLEWERSLSALYVKKGNYGTRITSIILVNANGEVAFYERSHALPIKKRDRILNFQIT